MKHATPQALDALAGLLAHLRDLPGLRETGRGVFYARSRAFLHFHEDPAGLFADIRRAAEWERFPVDTEAERRALLETVRKSLRSG